MNLPVIILGSGGHARVLIEALRAANVAVVGMTDADPAKWNTALRGIPILGNDDVIDQYRPNSIRLVNGLGSIDRPEARTSLFEALKKKGYEFLSVLHPSAIVAADAVLGEGDQVMAGAVIQPGCTIGSNVIINTNATVDHDCLIGDHVHVSPGATLCGNVRIGNGSHIGSGATVIQGITIGKNCLIAAGAVVISDVSDGSTVMGVPART